MYSNVTVTTPVITFPKIQPPARPIALYTGGETTVPGTIINATNTLIYLYALTDISGSKPWLTKLV